MWNVNYKVVQAKKSGDRTNWITVGAAFKREDKFTMKLETYPMPNEKGEVWLQLYERNTADEIQKENEKIPEQKTVYEKSYGGTAK
ncbi:MAG: replication initiator protein [Microviridae sp.]|nr:MAG: replication initiator protein [Microviridae sp.]